jgi:hypothetical protein
VSIKSGTLQADTPTGLQIRVAARLHTDALHTDSSVLIATAVTAPLRANAFTGHVAIAGGLSRLGWEIINEGPSLAGQVAFEVTLPSTITIRHAEVDGLVRTVTPNGTRWTTSLGDLDADTITQVVLIATTPDSPPPTTPATVTWNVKAASGTTPAIGTEPLDIIARSTLALTGYTVGSTAHPGDALTFGWKASNHGPSTARITRLVITTTPTGGFTPGPATGGTSATSGDTTTITNIPDIPPATDATIILPGTIPNTFTGATITAKATLELADQPSITATPLPVTITPWTT